MRFTALLFCIFSSLTQIANAEGWDRSNDPSALDSQYEYHFSKLPTEAELAVKPWSETYWPTFKGSINLRWNQPKEDGYAKVPSRDQVFRMSRDELARLSPSEKYDLLQSDYDFSLNKSVSRFTHKWVADWRGLCDGWTMAAIQFSEPKPIDVKNADGIVIPFGASDVKGLLSYYAQFIANPPIKRVGLQCTRWAQTWGKPACKDMNPGAMHVIMTNELGLKNKAFAMDRDKGKEIWNQPVYGFKTILLGSTAQGVLVHSTLFYTDELDKSSWEPVAGTRGFASDKIEMDYTLDLDSEGRIVGGDYIGKSDHPDNFWMPEHSIQFQGEFEVLKKLLAN